MYCPVCTRSLIHSSCCPIRGKDGRVIGGILTLDEIEAEAERMNIPITPPGYQPIGLADDAPLEGIEPKEPSQPSIPPMGISFPFAEAATEEPSKPIDVWGEDAEEED